MKKTFILLLGASLMLASCGMIAQTSSSDSEQRYQDGIYASSPSLRTKAEREEAKSETESLIEKTKASQIYLFGDKKDTVMIPENMYAKIQFDQKVGGTVVTVGENPYDWRWDLENNYGYLYGPYSIGASWYWSRHYSPYWSNWGFYSSWRYRGWYDPWYYGSLWADPWYYGSWYGNWYCTGWYDPWYYGGYWGWNDPWYYYHHHGWYNPPYHPGHGHHENISGTSGNSNRWHGLRANTVASSRRENSAGNTEKVTVRRGIGSSSSTSRSASVSRNAASASRGSASGRTASAPTYRRPANSSVSSISQNGESGEYTRGSSSGRSNSSSSQDRGYTSGYNRSSSSGGSSYSRSAPYGGGYSRGSYSGGGSGGSYSRGSSGSHRR